MVAFGDTRVCAGIPQYLLLCRAGVGVGVRVYGRLFST